MQYSLLTVFLVALAMTTVTSQAANIIDAAKMPGGITAAEIDASAGNLPLAELNAMGEIATVTFDDESKFSPYGPAEGFPRLLIGGSTPETAKLVITFSGPNTNWWQVLAGNPWMYHSANQSINLRGLPATPGEVYFTFSQPVEAVGFVLCNVIKPAGDKVNFYRDEAGLELIESVQLSGGEVHVEADGTPRGQKIFVGLKDSGGIRRVGFDLPANNVNNAYHRGFDDLTWKPKP